MTATIKARNGKTVTENVREILRELPEARNNDRLLMAYYWAVVDEVDFEGDFEDFTDSFAKATPPSSIQRARQMINYEAPDENLLPTNPRIKKLREKKAQIMRDKHERIKLLGRV
jgi:hypothetical protein